MPSEQCWVGIDAGADFVALCVMNDAGNVLLEEVSDASAASIAAVISKYPDVNTIGIEAGSTSIGLARSLRAAGFKVRVLGTYHVSTFLRLRQNKSDRNDAHGIAEILRIGWKGSPDVLVKSEQCQHLRSELVLRHRLMQQRLGMESAIRAVLRMNGGKLSKSSSGTHLEKSVTAEVARLATEGVDLGGAVLPALKAAVAIRRSVEVLTKRLTAIARANDVCRRLMTVPGVGCISALSFYTAIDDPERFCCNEDVGPYLGLAPTLHQSKQISRMGRISKRGNQMTRGHLVTAAKVLMQLSKYDNDLRRWAISLKARAGPSKARVALARKLAVVLLSIWKSGESFHSDRRASAQSA